MKHARLQVVRCCEWRGMALVELLLGLAITAVIGAAIAAMLAAVSYGTGQNNDSRRLVVQHKVLDARLGDAIRYSRTILASYADVQGASHLLVWMSDADENITPNLSELRIIRHDPVTGELASYKAAEPQGGWTQANDAAYAFNTDFAATVVPDLLAGVREPWGAGITAVAFRFGRLVAGSPSAEQVQGARLVSYRLTVGSGATETVIVGAAAMRNGL